LVWHKNNIARIPESQRHFERNATSPAYPCGFG
jgi:hypothetical protein